MDLGFIWVNFKPRVAIFSENQLLIFRKPRVHVWL